MDEFAECDGFGALASALRPGASNMKEFNGIDIPIPEIYSRLYEWHDGQFNWQDPESWVFAFGFLPHEVARAEHDRWRETFPDDRLMLSKCVPIGLIERGFVLMDLQSSVGRLIVSHDDDWMLGVAHESLHALLRSVIGAMNGGDFEDLAMLNSPTRGQSFAWCAVQTPK
jgi:hypothetical protein